MARADAEDFGSSVPSELLSMSAKIAGSVSSSSEYGWWQGDRVLEDRGFLFSVIPTPTRERVIVAIVGLSSGSHRSFDVRSVKQ